MLIVAILFLLILMINRWISHRLGRVIFCLIPVWATMLITLYFKHENVAMTYVVYFDNRFILMATTILPGIVFRLEERVQLLICLGSTALCLLFYDPIHELFGVGYYQKGFTEPSYSYISYVVSISFVTLLFGILLLRSVLERSESNLQKQNNALIEKQNEIEAQHEELLQQQEEMLSSSEKLSEANHVIMKQQEALTKYNETLEALVEEKSEDLLRTNEELVKHNNELIQFSYTVSHNLRGPVARLLGLTRLLKIAESDSEKHHLEDLILKSSVELDEIMKDLSLIIDIRNDLYQVREKVYLLNEWNKAVNLLGESAKSVFNLQVDFAQAPFVFAVRPMIQSIFYNLFSNAVKYQSPDRKLSVHVSSVALADGRTLIEITDNGLGIDMEVQEKNIFKLYKRFHPHVSGKGLGLYLVKTQVEALGGSISVSSTLDEGTTFRIILTQPEEVGRQVFYESDAAQLYYDANRKLTVIKWNKEVTSKEYRSTFDTVLNTLKTYSTPGWITDIRKRGIVSEEDLRWFANRIVPEAVKSGLKHVALIGLHTGDHQAHYERMKAIYLSQGIDMQIFDSVERALLWIEKYTIH